MQQGCQREKGAPTHPHQLDRGGGGDSRYPLRSVETLSVTREGKVVEGIAGLCQDRAKERSQR